MAKSVRLPKKWLMMLPAAFGVVLFIIYSFVWVQGAKIMDKEIAKFIENEQALGHAVEFEKKKIKGYPFTLRAQLDNFTWTAPGQWDWSGERLNIVTLPYDPTRIILAPRKQQTLIMNGQEYDIAAKAINVSLAEQEYAAEGDEVLITSGEEKIELEQFRANWFGEDDLSWIVGASFRKIYYTDKDGRVLHLPFWNIAASQSGAQTERLTLDGIEMAVMHDEVNAPSLLSLQGEVGIDDANYPDGTFNLKIRDQQALLETLSDFDIADAQTINQIKPVLSQMTSGNDDGMALPFKMKNGKLSIMSIPVADLPTVQ